MRRAPLICSVLFIGSMFIPELVFSAPTPLQPGWTVRKVADGFGLNFNGLAYDPVSTDLFTTEYNTQSVVRITQAGIRTTIYTATDMSADEMAFDPSSRIIYFGGVAQTVLRKVTEFGVFIEDVATPAQYTGLAIGPDGKLYVNSAFGNIIWRYNESDDSFASVFTGVGTGTNEGLAFDPSGNAYVASQSDSKIYKITPGGVVTDIGAIVGAGAVGVTFGDGSVFATGWGSDVFRLAPDGSGVTNFANGHAGVAGIHFGDNGRLYVNDANDGSIWEYSIGITPTTKVSWSALKSRYR